MADATTAAAASAWTRTEVACRCPVTGGVADLETINIFDLRRLLPQRPPHRADDQAGHGARTGRPVAAGGETEVRRAALRGPGGRTQPEDPSPDVNQYEIAVFFTGLDAEASASSRTTSASCSPAPDTIGSGCCSFLPMIGS